MPDSTAIPSPKRVDAPLPAGSPPVPRSGLGIGLFLIGVLFSASAISGVWVFWQLQQASQERQEFAEQLAQHRHQGQALEAGLMHVQQQLQEERQQRLLRQRELKEQLLRQQQSLDALAQQLREPAHALMSQWRMETARLLLSGVAAQLEPGYNLAAAQRLIDNALDLLAPLPDTQLIAVRRAIKVDLAALASASLPDLPHYRVQLGKHIARIKTLALRPQLRPAAATPSPTLAGDGARAKESSAQTRPTQFWSHLEPVGDWLVSVGSEMGSRLVSLVEVRSVEDADGSVPLFVAQRQREKLQWHLEQLQRALPQRDTQAVHEAADHTRDWLGQHFDLDNSLVGELHSLLEELSQLQFKPPPFHAPPSLLILEAMLGATHFDYSIQTQKRIQYHESLSVA